MTIICIRDGVIAADTLVTSGDTILGHDNKIHEVPSKIGGGFIAGCGETGAINLAIKDFCRFGFDAEMLEGHYNLIYLHSGGVHQYDSNSGWVNYKAPYFALGNGRDVALGAMWAGAGAHRAVLAACELINGCGIRPSYGATERYLNDL